MNIERVKRLLKQKENIRLEFKEAGIALPGNLFETICSMLNRDGGDILLGVQDNGSITGVDKASLDSMVKNLVNLSNNNQKLDPSFILYPQTYQFKDKTIIHIQVPASSQVHKTAGVIFDRSNDGDYKLIAPHQIAEIYNRKRNYYTEGIIYAAVRFKDFKISLFPKVKNLIKSNNPDHPWLTLNNEQLLEKAGLWKKDYHSGLEGYTLAAVLLFGKDEVIQQVVPHYKTDALVRIQDKLRYDDREYIQTNLIEAYEKLMGFVNKHLPDKFYMEGNQRISLRSKIFREVIANIIAHREYSNALPATFIIKNGTIETENANNPHGSGVISPDAFTPFPKNPTIAKFLMQLGWVEELGSGVINVSKYWQLYGNATSPQFIEGATFKIILPLSDRFFASNQDGNEGGTQDGNQDALSKAINWQINGGVSGGANDGANDGVNDGAIDGAIDGANDGANDTTNDTTNDSTNNSLKDSLNDGAKKIITKVVKSIMRKKGIKTADIALEIGKSIPTVRRYLKIAKHFGIIKFNGSTKTGGYTLTKSMLDFIENETVEKINKKVNEG